jgi:hypothetical protein
MTRISGLLRELHNALDTLLRSTDIPSDRDTLMKCQRTIRHCTLVKPPPYLDLVRMEQEIQAQVLWVRLYHTMILEGALGECMDDYLKEVVEGIEAVEECFGTALESQDWSTVAK